MLVKHVAVQSVPGVGVFLRVVAIVLQCMDAVVAWRVKV